MRAVRVRTLSALWRQAHTVSALATRSKNWAATGGAWRTLSSSAAAGQQHPPPPSKELQGAGDRSFTRALKLVAITSLAGAAAVVLPNLSATGAPHAVALMSTDSQTYRAAGASRAARLARSIPGGRASLAAAGAPKVLGPVIGSGDPAAAADACAVAAALVGVVEDGDLAGAAAAAGELVGQEGAAGEAARDFLWALKKKREGGGG